MEDEELAAIFVRGLPPLFNQLKVVFAIPGQAPATFDAAIACVRKFAADPTVAAELAKFKSNGLSQTMFPASAQLAQPAGAPRYSFPCRQFATSGTCSYGSRCRFSHTATPANSAIRQCTFCGLKGHTIEVCRKRLSRERNSSHANTSAPANNSVSLLSSSESALNVFHLDPAMVSGTPNPAISATTAPEIKHNVHVFALSDSAPNLSKWVLDSGATCCATYAEADCVDVRECQAHVTAAGSTFSVNKMGTAVIETQDEKGRPVQLRMTDTLISSKFPYKLLALQQFTRKGGHEISMTQDSIRIRNNSNDTVFVGLRDSQTQLFFLQQPAAVSASEQSSLLARSYGSGGKSDLDLLWKLHVRHGHRNFVDVARQYNLTLPSEIPACTVIHRPHFLHFSPPPIVKRMYYAMSVNCD